MLDPEYLIEAVETHSLATFENNSCLVFILEILSHSLTEMNRNTQFILGIIENHCMQFPSVAVEGRRRWIVFGSRLRVNELTRPFVYFEAVIFQVDTEWSQTLCNGAVRPATKDTAGIGSEGDDVSQGLEL